jgi:hypothetical protein
MAVDSTFFAFLCLCGIAAARADSACDADAYDASASLLQTRLALEEHIDSKASREQVSTKEVFLAAARNETLYQGLPENWSNIISMEFPQLAQFNASAPISLYAYHKTGHDLTTGYANLRHNLTGESVADCWGSVVQLPNGGSTWMTDCEPAELMIVPGGRELFTEFIARDSGWPHVHWIREPVHMILSAYRYHTEDREPAWEENMLQPLHPYDDARTLGWIFQSCSNNCSYFQLISSLNETDGVIVEALNMRSEITHMLSHTMVSADMPNVLHLSMEHLTKDFNGTMACMNRFLGSKGLPDQMLPQLSSLDVHQNAPMTGGHVTSGKYDNTPLEELLLSEPVWGAEFREARTVVSKIFERQANYWGCPVPD